MYEYENTEVFLNKLVLEAGMVDKRRKLLLVLVEEGNTLALHSY